MHFFSIAVCKMNETVVFLCYIGGCKQIGKKCAQTLVNTVQQQQHICKHAYVSINERTNKELLSMRRLIWINCKHILWLGAEIGNGKNEQNSNWFTCFTWFTIHEHPTEFRFNWKRHNNLCTTTISDTNIGPQTKKLINLCRSRKCSLYSKKRKK